MLLRLHGGADVIAAGLLLDCRGDDGGVRYASLVEAVWGRSHHVGGEAAGHQAARATDRKVCNGEAAEGKVGISSVQAQPTHT